MMSVASYLFRTALAVVAFAAVSGLALFFVGVLGAGFSYGIVDSLFPAISGVTYNTNTMAPSARWLVQWFLCPTFSLLTGCVAAGLILDPGVLSKLERFLLIIILVVLVAMSGVNFAFDDAIISVKAQAFIDFFVVLVGVSSLSIFLKWKPARHTAIGVRFVAIYGITMFGIILPSWFGTAYVLMLLGVKTTGLESLDQWVKIFGAVLSLAITALTFRRGKEPAE